MKTDKVVLQNADGLYEPEMIEERFGQAIEAYDQMLDDYSLPLAA